MLCSITILSKLYLGNGEASVTGDTELMASVPDEDAQSAIVDDDNILAEVTLAHRSRESTQ